MAEVVTTEIEHAFISLHALSVFCFSTNTVAAPSTAAVSAMILQPGQTLEPRSLAGNRAESAAQQTFSLRPEMSSVSQKAVVCLQGRGEGLKKSMQARCPPAICRLSR